MSRETLQRQLKNLLSDPQKVRNLKTKNGKTLGEILKTEAEQLADLIQDEIDSLYSRPENWYKRTQALKKSLKVDIDETNNTIEIGFNDLAFHESYFTKYNPGYHNEGFVPLLMNDGFQKLFTAERFEPTNFIERAIEHFNQTKPPGITVKLTKTYDGNKYYDDYL